MRFWYLHAKVNNFVNFFPVIKWSLSDLRSFDGRPKKKEWKPIEVGLLDEEEDLEFSDILGFNSMSHIPTFSERAINELKSLIKKEVEFLPLLPVERRKYYLINVIDVVDCLDLDNSVVKKTPDDKLIILVNRYSLFESKLRGKNIFKIAGMELKRPFVSDLFKEKVENSGLTGFQFDLVWDSSLEPDNQPIVTL
jgi:hypothetical protein